MFLLVILAVAVGTVPLAGGSLGRLGDMRLRWTWALYAAIGLQIIIISVIPDRLIGIHAPVHVGSYALAAAFLVVNRRIRGLWIIGLGGLANLTAILANGGVMPASASALDTAGIAADTGQFANSTTLADPELSFLGDVFAIPASWPVIGNVFSVGDVLIGVGAVVLLHGVCGTRLAPARRKRAIRESSSHSGSPRES